MGRADPAVVRRGGHTSPLDPVQRGKEQPDSLVSTPGPVRNLVNVHMVEIACPVCLFPSKGLINVSESQSTLDLHQQPTQNDFSESRQVKGDFS